MAEKSGNKFAADAIKIFEAELTKEQLAEGQARAAKCYTSNYKDCDSFLVKWKKILIQRVYVPNIIIWHS